MMLSHDGLSSYDPASIIG